MALDQTDIGSLLSQAFDKHKQGRLSEAEQLYKVILVRDRTHFDALQLLGLCYYQAMEPAAALNCLNAALAVSQQVPSVFNNRGIVLRALNRNLEATRDFDAALRLKPDFADAHYNKGNALHALGQLEEARKHLEEAVRLNPAKLEFLNNLAGVLSELNHHAAALTCYRKITELHPDNAAIYLNIGLTLHNLKRFDEAMAAYNRAIGLNARLAEAYSRRGDALREQGKLADALIDCETAIRLNPGLPEAHCSLGNVLKEMTRFDNALASYETAVNLRPDYAEAFSNRGVVLRELKRLDEALASFDQAMGLKKDYAEALASRGNVLSDLDRLDEALASYEAAIGLKQDYAEAYFNRGNVLGRLKRFDDALASYDRCVSLKPDYAEAYHNKALLLLRMQEFQNGFALYARRWNAKDFTSPALMTGVPAWDGTSAGRVLLWSEQGIGDEIFYASMLSLINRDVSITLLADRRLHQIYKRSFPGISLLDHSIRSRPFEAAFDAQAPIGDLGFLLGVSAERISQRTYPFLRVDSERRRKLVADNDFLQRKPVCGVAWRSVNKRFGEDKSIRLPELAPLLGTSDITFVNLQYGDVSEDIDSAAESIGTRVHRARDLDVFQDIEGLLALIDACDIVLTTSNVTAHLAGSIGKKAAVLVPAGKGRLWYWHDQPQSIWYPSLRLFSQRENCEWSDPILQAIHWIRDNTEWSG